MHHADDGAVVAVGHRGERTEERAYLGVFPGIYLAKIGRERIDDDEARHDLRDGRFELRQIPTQVEMPILPIDTAHGREGVDTVRVGTCGDQSRGNRVTETIFSRQQEDGTLWRTDRHQATPFPW